MEISEDEYRKMVLEIAAARGHAMPAADAPVARDSWWTRFFIVGVLLLLSFMVADHFRLIPPAIIDKIAGPPQVQISTPLPTARQVEQQPVSAPIPVGAPAWPTLTPEPPTATPEPTHEALPPMAQPNLVPSKPGDNPGFTCGVEPGMAPNATCDPDEDAQSLSVPKMGPRHVGERGSDKAGPGGGE